eukprot:scaffold2705_cov109-Isochrysis_galbana.AAC.20
MALRGSAIARSCDQHDDPRRGWTRISCSLAQSHSHSRALRVPAHARTHQAHAQKGYRCPLSQCQARKAKNSSPVRLYLRST